MRELTTRWREAKRKALSHKKKMRSQREIKGAKKRVKASYTQWKREGKDLRILFARWTISRILKISGLRALCVRVTHTRARIVVQRVGKAISTRRRNTEYVHHLSYFPLDHSGFRPRTFTSWINAKGVQILREIVEINYISADRLVN